MEKCHFCLHRTREGRLPACVEACPVQINPLEIILELRRFVTMEESGAPAAWNGMYQNIETSFAPWKFSPADRFNWAKED